MRHWLVTLEEKHFATLEARATFDKYTATVSGENLIDAMVKHGILEKNQKRHRTLVFAIELSQEEFDLYTNGEWA